jgi:hypothetical protein
VRSPENGLMDKASNPMRWLGTACLTLGLCAGASADTSATKHKQPHHPETESHKSEAKANAAQGKAAHADAKSTSKADSTHHSAHSATAHKKAHSAGTTGSHHGKKSRPVSSRHGQQKIDSDRTRQIQEALIREHYLSGEPSGKWDPETEAALRKLQTDHGWQNKTVPDSRALIKLGLGPNHDHLLNPDSAMTTAPEAARVNVPSTANDPPVPPSQAQQ